MDLMNAIRRSVEANQQPYTPGSSMNGTPEFIHFRVDPDDTDTTRFPKYCPRFECCLGMSKRQLIIVSTLATVAVVIVLASLFSSAQASSAPEPSSANVPKITLYSNVPAAETVTTRPADVRSQLATISDAATLVDNNSSQYKAYMWLLDEDPLKLQAQSPSLKQRYVLVLLFFSSDGPNWTLRDPWIETLRVNDHLALNQSLPKIGLETECSWEGVECDENNYISGLLLGSSGLKGQLPVRELEFLTHLKNLDLSGNQIMGDVSDSLKSLDHLENLLLDDTKIHGAISAQVCAFKELKRITIDCENISCSCCDNCKGLQASPVISPTSGSLPPSTKGEVKTREEAITDLIQEVSADDAIKSGTPQNKALNWILFGDDQHASIHDTNLMQRYVLAVLYYSLGGEKWLFSSSWLLGKSSECDYPGVACNGNGVVIEISLVASGLSGSIPKEIGVLDDLTFLDLSNNKIGGVIPIQLANLEELESLLLHDNEIKGVVPLLICNLRESDLKDLKVDCDSDIPKVTCDCCSNCEIRSTDAGGTDEIGEKESSSPTSTPTPETTHARVDYAAKYGNRGDHISSILHEYAEEIFWADTPWFFATEWIIATDTLELESSDRNLVQRWVLAVLYFQLNGENWSYTNFLHGIDECQWDQIVCDSEGDITGITLINGNLKGEVPFVLAALTKLVILDLRGNELSGEVPEVLCLDEDVKAQFDVLVLDCDTPSNIDCECCTPCS